MYVKLFFFIKLHLISDPMYETSYMYEILEKYNSNKFKMMIEHLLLKCQKSHQNRSISNINLVYVVLLQNNNKYLFLCLEFSTFSIYNEYIIILK